MFAHGIRAGANIAWSLAYTWVVGAALDLVAPSRPHELLVVMAINLVIVVVVLVTFAWWLHELFALLRHRRVGLVVSEPVIRVLAYGLLAWATLTEASCWESATSDHAYLALAIAGILTYLPLLVVTRYIAAYIAILAVTAFLLMCSRPGWAGLPRRVINRVALATLLVRTLTFVYAALRPADHVAHQLAGGAAPGTSDLRVARALTRAGIGARSGIAFVGESDGVLSAYWARPGDAAGALEARAAVTDEPQARLNAGWVRIAGTGDSNTLLEGARG